MERIKIALIDDQQLFRQGLALLINSIPEFELLFEASNGEDFLQTIKHQAYPQIVLLDMEMPVMNGIELNKQLHEQYPSIKVIILSVHDKQRLITHMIQAGACGYLLKNCDKEELIAAIKMVHHSGFYLNEQVLKVMQNASVRKQEIKSIDGISIDLSSREREILELICREYNNAEIGEKLFISPRTVEGHRNNLLAKSGCRNTAGLVLFAVKSHIYNVIS
ncbi:response regulator transcription factor [Arachidicoccus sp.]|uniref:response regulator transcription factor n=1 Tax=Arachidicoccus sp. TaxID=1872624 RepID=UPI003D23C32B